MAEDAASASVLPGGVLVEAPSAEDVMAKAGRENFPVASRLLPRRTRGHLLAIYGFARLVDDAGDESAGDRLLLLAEIERDLGRLYLEGKPRIELIRRLGTTVGECRIPPEPFRRLIAANRQDQAVTRYATIGELLAYCELSANPVGQLVLHVLGAATPERIRLSDSICSGLQLTEHWQDVREDLERGRIYVPAEDMERFGCTLADLRSSPATPALRELMAFEVERARRLLDRGRPLVRTLPGRHKLAVAAFVAGGHAALDVIADSGYDVSGGAKRPGRRRLARELLSVLARRRRSETA
jgi:squalene synthase HpnC